MSKFIEMLHLGLPPSIDFCAFPCYTGLVRFVTDCRRQKKPLRFLARAAEQSLSETSRTIQILIELVSNRVKVDSVDKVKSFYGGKFYDKQ